jgi:hypothetical protein
MSGSIESGTAAVHAAAVHTAPATDRADGFAFTFDRLNISAGATITGYSGPLGAVVIPSTLATGDTTYVVTAIGNFAFAGIQLSSVVIPDSVTAIGNFAFANNLLTAVTIGTGVTTIGNFTFAYNQLSSIVISDSVITIGDHAFADNQLTAVAVGTGVTTLGNYAFAHNKLSSVAISNRATGICHQPVPAGPPDTCRPAA